MSRHTDRTSRWLDRLNLLQLFLAGVIVIAPTLWMVLSSFKPSYAVTAYPPTIVFQPCSLKAARVWAGVRR